MVEKKDDGISHVLIDKNEQVTVLSEDFASIYANNIHLNMSIFDFGLTFGEVTSEKKGNKNIIKQKVKVILSKEMTKVLLTLLNTNVKAYEAAYGEIVIPKAPPAKEKQVLASATRRKKK